MRTNSARLRTRSRFGREAGWVVLDTALLEVMRAAGVVELLPGDRHGQALAPLAATGGEHAAPAFRLHPLAEAVGPLAATVVRLECALHGILLSSGPKKRGCIA